MRIECSLSEASDRFENLVCGFRPLEWLWVVIVRIEIFLNRVAELGHAVVRKKSDRSVGRERSGESCGDSRRNEWSRGRAKICARVVADVGGVECRARERNGAGSRPGW
jgi:hypothetical protein